MHTPRSPACQLGVLPPPRAARAAEGPLAWINPVTARAYRGDREYLADGKAPTFGKSAQRSKAQAPQPLPPHPMHITMRPRRTPRRRAAPDGTVWDAGAHEKRALPVPSDTRRSHARRTGSVGIASAHMEGVTDQEDRWRRRGPLEHRSRPPTAYSQHRGADGKGEQPAPVQAGADQDVGYDTGAPRTTSRHPLRQPLLDHIGIGV